MTNSKKIKDLIITYHLGCKNICISCPIVRTDNRKANNVLKRYLYTKNKKKMLFFHNNILEADPCRYGFHLKSNWTTMLSGNFISRIGME